jgi:hypothetical protein
MDAPTLQKGAVKKINKKITLRENIPKDDAATETDSNWG